MIDFRQRLESVIRSGESTPTHVYIYAIIVFFEAHQSFNWHTALRCLYMREDFLSVQHTVAIKPQATSMYVFCHAVPEVLDFEDKVIHGLNNAA